MCVREGRKWEARYHDNGEVDLEGLRTHDQNNNNSRAFAGATPHSQLTCTVCACLLISIALPYSFPAPLSTLLLPLHCTTLPAALGITTFDLPTLLAASGFHPSSNLQSFAFAALTNGSRSIRPSAISPQVDSQQIETAQVDSPQVNSPQKLGRNSTGAN